ncbi:MAG: DUF2304 domain-containing protein [Victivallaceae bacterium]
MATIQLSAQSQPSCIAENATTKCDMMKWVLSIFLIFIGIVALFTGLFLLGTIVANGVGISVFLIGICLLSIGIYFVFARIREQEKKRILFGGYEIVAPSQDDEDVFSESSETDSDSSIGAGTRGHELAEPVVDLSDSLSFDIDEAVTRMSEAVDRVSGRTSDEALPDGSSHSE